MTVELADWIIDDNCFVFPYYTNLPTIISTDYLTLFSKIQEVLLP